MGLVRIATCTKYSYDGLIDFLAKMHLSTTLQDISTWPYADFINTDKLRNEAFVELMSNELYNYISQFYPDEYSLNQYKEYLKEVMPRFYNENTRIQIIFLDTINRMRTDGISHDNIKEAANYLRVM